MKNLVFTSCGDRANPDDLWIGKGQEYHVIGVYYGDSDKRFQQYCKRFRYCIRRKGSKFQNFFALFEKRHLFRTYNRFFILDDDIVMNVEDINRLFTFSYEHQLSICQPAYANHSKISHDCTKQLPNAKMHYTNFIEVGASLFSRQSIEKLASVYEPNLVCWGIDYLSIWIDQGKKLPNSECKKYAIIDEVTCVNPFDSSKGGQREIELHPDCKRRKQLWESYATKIGAPLSYKPKTLAVVY